MKKSIAGFTLTEILVVVSIVSILSAVVYANFNDGSKQSRDAKRKADLINVQAALELYRQDNNGQYPAGCNGVNWSGQTGTSYACSGGDSRYIVGLSPKYIKVLPKDPKPGTGDYGYVYRTNAERTVYKFVARNSVEVDTVSYNQPFSGCEYIADVSDSDLDGNDTTALCSLTDIPPEWNNKCGLGRCNMINISGTCVAAAGNYKRFNDASFLGCSPGNINNSYAVWGGYADDTDPKKVECYTEKVICDMPPTSTLD